MGDVGLSAGDVAARLGVAVTTVRTWHRRYGLGPSGHVARRHRRYTDDDVSRLEVMRKLTARGVPAAEAARRALAGPGGARPTGWDGRRAGGGRVLAVGRAGAPARGLARAATRLDSPMMLTTIAEALAAHGVVDTWEAMLRPVLVGVGAGHARTGRLVEVEHLLSRCISETLSATVVRSATARPPDGEPRVLLACAAEEQHSLPLEALAAALAENGVGCRQLGARVPARALWDAVGRIAPAVVVVWSHAPETADTGLLEPLLADAGRPAVVAAAGPGWAGCDLPEAVDAPASLGEALTLVLDAAR